MPAPRGSRSSARHRGSAAPAPPRRSSVNSQIVGALARRMRCAYRGAMKMATAAPAPQPTGTAAQRLAIVRATLAAEAAAGGHAVPQLIAVSKTFGADAIRPLIAAGQRAFGENRVQEAA